jgi:hypothetical protein
VAYRYISKSNEKAKELREAANRRGTVDILPPEPATAAASEPLGEARPAALISSEVEDFSRRY